MSQETAADRQVAEQIAQAEADASISAASMVADAHEFAYESTAKAQLDATRIGAESDPQAAYLVANARVTAAQGEVEARIEVESALAVTRAYAAGTQGEARITAANLSGRSQVESASMAADARISNAGDSSTSEVALSRIDADTRVRNAELVADARTAQATRVSAARVAASQAQSQARLSASSATATARIDAAQAGADADRIIADIQASARVQSSAIGDTNRVALAQLQADAARKIADGQQQYRTFAIDTNESAQDFAADQATYARVQSATIDAAAGRYSADRDLAGVVLHQSRELARLQRRIDWAQQRFDTIFPYLHALPGGATLEPLPTLVASGIGPIDADIRAARSFAEGRVQVESDAGRQALASRGFASTARLGRDLGTLAGFLAPLATTGIDAVGLIGAAEADSELLAKQQDAQIGATQDYQQAQLQIAANAARRQIGYFGAVSRLVTGLS